MIVVSSIALALAAPAAALTPADGGQQGWTWSSVVEHLAGWAGGVLGVFGASETPTDPTGGDETSAPTDDSGTLLTDDGSGQTEAVPEFDPNG